MTPEEIIRISIAKNIKSARIPEITSTVKMIFRELADHGYRIDDGTRQTMEHKPAFINLQEFAAKG